MKMLLSVAANALALWVASLLIPGIQFGGEGWSLVLTALGVGLLFGVLNSVVRPLLQILSIPLILVTLGLFLLVINAIMLWMTSWLAGVLTLDFNVATFFWDAVLGSIIVSVVGMVTGTLLPADKRP